VRRKLAGQGWDGEALRQWYATLPVAELPPPVVELGAMGGAARDKQIVVLRRQGLTQAEIAKRLGGGLTQGGVSRALTRMDSADTGVWDDL